MAMIAPIGGGHTEAEAADRLTGETAAEPYTTRPTCGCQSPAPIRSTKRCKP
jgi:hypothetical protein